MESMRAEWRADCGLDMYQSMTLPSASLQALLYNTGVHVELITEENGGSKLMQLLDHPSRGIKGGLSCIFQPYARANNPRVLEALPPRLCIAEPANDDRSVGTATLQNQEWWGN